MKFSWRSIGKGILKGLGMGAKIAAVVPFPGSNYLALLEDLIDNTEDAYADAIDAGLQKHQAVVAAANAILKSKLANLTPEQLAKFAAAQDEAIKSIVAAKHAYAASVAAADQAKLMVNAYRDAIEAL